MKKYFDIHQTGSTHIILLVSSFYQHIQEAHGENIIATFPGCPGDKSKKVFILGAHYDSETRTHGFDDNGSGVTVLLKVAEGIAKYLKTYKTGRVNNS